VTLLMICPSRGRPGNVAALLECWALLECFADADARAELMIVVDDDDPELPGYQALGVPLTVNVTEQQTAPRGIGGILNALACQHAADYDAIGFLGDDHRPRTPGWDTVLAAAIADGAAVAYGNDLHQGERLPTAPVIASPVITALGYFCPPGMMHMYLDDFWKRLGADLGALTYLPDVIIEHCHPDAGKSFRDEGYNRVAASYPADEAAWQRFLADSWPGELARLKERLHG
jgi:hypothetical protein